MNDFLNRFLPFGVVITLFSVLVYGVNQQEIRKAANNPQIEVAENAVDLINSGVPPFTLFASRAIDIENRLSTFQVIYDDQGNVIGSNAKLDGKSPVLPQGVFDYTRENKEDRITWEPKPGQRFAAVVMRYGSSTSTTTSGFVLAARSLREIEQRQKDLMKEVLIGWAVTILLTAGALYLTTKKEVV